jgi:CRP-like cAMP-binding protein
MLSHQECVSMVKNLLAPRPLLKDRPENSLLRALPDPDFSRLRPDLKTVPTSVKHVFHKQSRRIDYVYFPNGGVTSVTVALSDGTTLETATIGLEGMLGIEAYLGEAAEATGETMMQISGTTAEQLSVIAFRRELARGGALANLVGRYAQAMVAQVMQSAACNARHQVLERCSRWLLMTHDRVGRAEFQLSHEFLGVMLGVRRQSVTVVAGTLQAAGLITYKRGHIKILDRHGLEAASCECYAVVRRKFDALFS